MFLTEDKDRAIVKILASGMVLLAICLLTCVAHVWDIRMAFQRESKHNFEQQMFTSTKALSAEFDSVLQSVQAMADKLSRPSVKASKDEIIELLKKNRENYVDLFYLASDNKLYTYKGTYREIEDDEFLKSVKYLNSGKIMLQKWRKNGRKGYYAVFSDPVMMNVDTVGHVVAYVEISDVLKGKAFTYLNQMGHCFLTDGKGNIVAGLRENRSLVNGNTNIYDGFIEVLHSSSGNRLEIKDFQEKMRKSEKDVLELRNEVGDKLLVTYQKIEGTEDIYFVYCYNEDLAEKRIQPVIFRSTLTCIFIIILMIVAILFVWAFSKRSNHTVEKMAYEDPVTRGKNLNYFKERALEVMYANREMPFLIQRFDIANFRYINETYGHKRADELLKGCIEVAKECFLEKELCIRMDSDNFLLLTQNDGRIEQRREDYLYKLNGYARSIGIKYPIRLKFGIYQVRKNDKEIDVMIDKANIARKSLAGDEKVLQAYYSDSIVEKLRKVNEVETEMQKALDTGQFKVYLQPKWDILEDKPIGVEALVRWQKEDGSIVAPNEFIPIFEKNGFVEKLDFYMLESCCKQMCRMLNKGIHVYPVSINQSRVLWNNPDYLKNVKRILEHYEIPSELVELELTETVFTDNKEKMLQIMNELKKMNITISIDDFGSGYSSLNILKDMSFDVLKLDREFVRESLNSKSSQWILQKIVEMAHGLGMFVVCEGVETKEQVETLKQIGCRYAQGYYYGKPMPMDEFNQKYNGATG